MSKGPQDSFYGLEELYSKGGDVALQAMSKREPVLKNRVAPAIEVDMGSRSSSRAGARCEWGERAPAGGNALRPECGACGHGTTSRRQRSG